MRSIEVIPAIDLIGGRCVRLTQGDYSRMNVYSEDPVEVARHFRHSGAERLHLVDLDGAKASHPVNLDVLNHISAATDLVVEFGGGIKSEKALVAALEAGASYVICGSVAVTDPDSFSRWLDKYPGRIILGIDIRNGLVATRGWLDTSSVTAYDLMNRFRGGLNQVIVTRIDSDGMMDGVDTAFYKSLQETFSEVDIIVSGGVSSEEDLSECEKAGLRSVIVGKAFYEGRLDPSKVFWGGDSGC